MSQNGSMQPEQYFFADSIYRPSIFVIQIQASTTDFNEMPDSEFGFYFHEYIHFLQDITTIYGLTAMSVHLHLTAFAVDALRNTQSLQDKYSALRTKPEIKKQIDDHLASRGNKIPNGFNKDDFDKLRIDISTVKSYESHIEFDLVDNSNGNRSIFKLGSHCIIESMAYEIEYEIFKISQYISVSRFPYRIVKDFCREYLDKSISTFDFTEICELSLMSTTPGRALLFYLQQKKDRKFDAKKYSIDIGKGKPISFNDALRNKYQLELKEYIPYVYGGKFRKEMYTFIDSFYKNALDLKHNSPLPISSLANENITSIREKILNLHTSVGAPNILINNHYIGANSNPPDAMKYAAPFCVMGQMFHNYIWSDSIDYKCPFINTCKEEGTHDIYNGVKNGVEDIPYRKNTCCELNFYRNAIQNQIINGIEQYCPAGAVIVSLGLENIATTGPVA